MDLLEQVAAKLHEGWMQHKEAAGVVYGPKRTRTKHPHFKAWTDLDDVEAKNQDRFQAALILHAWAKGKITKADLPAAIHNFWVIWEELQGTSHPHALPYKKAHLHGPDEHAAQADLIWPILTAIDS